MPPILVNTSNPDKLAEFRAFLSPLEVQALERDLDEPASDALTIIRYKASQFENVLVDDTSLEIDGAEVGVQVRWLLENLDQYQGRPARFICLLGIHRNSKVEVYRGEVPGTIVAPRGQSFGFNPYFEPKGQKLTLAESMPKHLNARYLAIQRLLSRSPDHHLEPLLSWAGAFQRP